MIQQIVKKPRLAGRGGSQPRGLRDKRKRGGQRNSRPGPHFMPFASPQFPQYPGQWPQVAPPAPGQHAQYNPYAQPAYPMPGFPPVARGRGRGRGKPRGT